MFPLVVTELSKSYGSHQVVRDLTFTASPGRVTGFLGPNGAGKSTTMKILLDLAAADHGTARIGAHRYRDLPEPATTVGVVLEPDAFHPGRSGRNHLRVLADVSGFSTRRIDEVLDMVGLTDAAHRRVGAYSLGMRQRLSLAGALLGDPPVLVLDEPGNGLDPQGIHDLRAVLRDRAAQGHTIFVSSHLLAEVELLADDLVVVDKGRLVTTGALADLKQAAVTVRSPRAADLAVRLDAAGGTVEPGDVPGTLTVRGLTTDLIGDLAFNAGIALHELTAGSGSLEQMFLRWTGDEPADGTSRRSRLIPSAATTRKEVVRS
jgi:ABC-2 type transport system ATP-binding protein